MKANALTLALIIAAVMTTCTGLLQLRTEPIEEVAQALEVNDKPAPIETTTETNPQPEPMPEAPVEPATDPAPEPSAPKVTNAHQSSPTKKKESATPSGSAGDFKSAGVIRENGYRYTWYSTNENGQTVTAYPIPGKTVGGDGIIRDKDGYVCVAANKKTAGKHEVVDTPFGKGKVYDTGCAAGTIDIYTNF